jgi:hypothetical protein
MAGPMRKLQSFAALPAMGAPEPVLSALAKKLRLRADQTVAILNSPAGYLELLAPGPSVVVVEAKPDRTYDAVQLFVNSVEELRSLGSTAIHAVKPDGTLWVTYPKGGKTRGATDLPATPWWTKRDVLGELTGETGYKPVAFVSIDDNWTALRFKRA